MTAAVTAHQRHTRAHRCPICDGADGDPRGKGKRCSGFDSADGEYVHCSREELAGGIDANGAGLFAHRMHGPCKCGLTHGPASSVRIVDSIEAVYPYTDERGMLLFEVVRKTGKRFLQRKPDGAGAWSWKLGDVRRVPYRLVDLIEDNADRTVYIVEGEKDADALAKRGHLATCNPGGAGKWSAVASTAREVLAGREVVVVADADDVGRKHALEVAASLRDVARSVRVTECPAPHKDVSDLLAAGGQMTELVEPATGKGEEQVSPPARYVILGPEDIFAPIPTPTYTIGGLLRQGNLALAVAFGSSLKTWLMVDALLAAATGARFLDRFDCGEPIPTLAIDWESGAEELRRRIQADARARGLVFPVPNMHAITMPDLFFTSPDFERELDALAERFKFIALDSLAAGSVDVDENDARFAKGLQICRRVGERRGTSFLVLHHSRKDGGDESDERQMVRGTGAIFAAADVVLSLRRKKGDGESFVVRQTKARGGKRVDPFLLSVEDLDGGAVRVFASGLEDASDDADATAAPSAALAKAKAAIIRLLATERDLRSANDVVRRLPKCGGRQAVLGGLRELTEHGIVTTHEARLRLASEVT